MRPLAPGATLVGSSTPRAEAKDGDSLLLDVPPFALASLLQEAYVSSVIVSQGESES